jgi:hypothetical protein
VISKEEILPIENDEEKHINEKAEFFIRDQSERK